MKKELIPHLRKTHKLGHGGTLDPAATGVLVVGVGDGTRRLQEFLTGTKTYVCTGILGAETDTDDSSATNITKRAPFEHVTREMIAQVLPQFTGVLKQKPPIYSALKMDGEPLYRYAARGKEPPREIVARDVKVYSLELLDFTNDHPYHYPTNYYLPASEAARAESVLTRFRRRVRDPTLPPPAPVFRLLVESGAGFYVRSLVRDVARALGSAAHVVQLERCRQGMFGAEDCLPLDSVLGDRGRDLVIAALKKSEAMLPLRGAPPREVSRAGPVQAAGGGGRCEP